MDDGVILQPDDSQKPDPAPAADPKAADPSIGVAKNAPGFDDPLSNVDGDKVFDITPDLNIAPIKEGEAVFVEKMPPKPPRIIPPVNPVPPVQPAPVSIPTATPAQSGSLPTKPGSEPRPMDVEQPIHKSAPVIASNIPNRSALFSDTAKSTLIQPPPQVMPSGFVTAENPAPAPAPKPVTPETSSAPIPPANVKTFESSVPLDPNIKPLRTYEGDVAEALAREHASVASIAVAAAQKKQEEAPVVQEEEVPQGSGAAKKILFVVLSLAFVGAGIIGAYYLYSKSPLAPATPVTPEQKVAASLVPSDSYVLLPADNLNAITLKSRIESEMGKSQPANTIKEIIPTKIVVDQTMRIGAPEMADIMDIDVPDKVLRSLGKPLMIGVYADSQGQKSLFTVVTTEFFQNTFAGMLAWENLMADDLKFYLFPENVRGVSTIEGPGPDNTSANPPTGTTTPPAATNVQPLFTIRGRFIDRNIKNKDVREFVSDDGKILFLYSFVDNNKLVMTNNEDTLIEILTRLEKAATIR